MKRKGGLWDRKDGGAAISSCAEVRGKKGEGLRSWGEDTFGVGLGGGITWGPQKVTHAEGVEILTPLPEPPRTL